MKDYEKQLFLSEGKWHCESIYRRDKDNIIKWIDDKTMKVYRPCCDVTKIVHFTLYGYCFEIDTIEGRV